MRNLDSIEKLFKEKFESFEANVNPEVWANIQSGLSSVAGSAGGTAAKFTLGKLITGVVATAGISGSIWYFSVTENKVAENSLPVQTKKETVLLNKTEPDFSIKNVSAEKNKNEKTVRSNGFQHLISQNKNAEPIEIASLHEPAVLAVPQEEAPPPPSFPYKPKLGKAPKGDRGLSRIDQNYLKAKTAKENAEKQSYQNEEESISEEEPMNDKQHSSVTEKKPAAEINLINVFSPNGDGYNDLFKINCKNVLSLSVVIYNQNGEMIARWNTPEGSWDGKLMNGNDAPEGVYFYSIKATGADGAETIRNGNLTLFRK